MSDTTTALIFNQNYIIFSFFSFSSDDLNSLYVIIVVKYYSIEISFLPDHHQYLYEPY